MSKDIKNRLELLEQVNKKKLDTLQIHNLFNDFEAVYISKKYLFKDRTRDTKVLKIEKIMSSLKKQISNL